jgi:hypothetical protein
MKKREKYNTHILQNPLLKDTCAGIHHVQDVIWIYLESLILFTCFVRSAQR